MYFIRQPDKDYGIHASSMKWLLCARKNHLEGSALSLFTLGAELSSMIQNYRHYFTHNKSALVDDFQVLRKFTIVQNNCNLASLMLKL